MKQVTVAQEMLRRIQLQQQTVDFIEIRYNYNDGHILYSINGIPNTNKDLETSTNLVSQLEAMEEQWLNMFFTKFNKNRFEITLYVNEDGSFNAERVDINVTADINIPLVGNGKEAVLHKEYVKVAALAEVAKECTFKGTRGINNIHFRLEASVSEISKLLLKEPSYTVAVANWWMLLTEKLKETANREGDIRLERSFKIVNKRMIFELQKANTTIRTLYRPLNQLQAEVR